MTVAREIFRNLPNERIIYFGDTARVPYGNKSPETIIRYSKQIASFLISKDVKAIVIACNTASALALDAVREELDIPIIGVVEPGARAASRETHNRHIGVIGTTATVSSGLYDKYIKQFNEDAVVSSKDCPLFVSLVEEGMIDDEVTNIMIHRYLDKMVAAGDIDTLILGCTHYPLLGDVIAREIGAHKAGEPACGNPITLVNPAYETAMALKGLLDENGLASDRSDAVSLSEHEFFVSDGAKKFKDFAKEVLGMEINDIQVMPLA